MTARSPTAFESKLPCAIDVNTLPLTLTRSLVPFYAAFASRFWYLSSEAPSLQDETNLSKVSPPGQNPRYVKRMPVAARMQWTLANHVSAVCETCLARARWEWYGKSSLRAGDEAPSRPPFTSLQALRETAIFPSADIFRKSWAVLGPTGKEAVSRNWWWRK
jgi:hypothetical protein